MLKRCNSKCKIANQTFSSIGYATHYSIHFPSIAVRAQILTWTDLKPLDTFIRGYIKVQAHCIEPDLISELQRAVEDVTASIATKMPSDAAQSMRKRARACLEASGGQ